MSNPSQAVKSEIQEVPSEIIELAHRISQLPDQYRDALDETLTKVIESAKRRRRVLGLVQDALSQLRLDMKYLVFDLEATRRERDDYRRQLEQA